jgi:mannose-1-phosphate guanylyltransferase
MNQELFAVIMAGGSGTRFWPASRRLRPKQLLPIAGDEALLVQTVRRLAGAVALEQTLIVTGADQAAAVRALLPELPRENVLAEPGPRNTGPCIALAAEEIARRAPQSVQVVLPADHVIHPAAAFQSALRAAAAEARESGALVTLGIRPTFAATGYGYVELGQALPARAGHAVHAVARFVEKPDAVRAREFLAGGRHLWNGGIFVWRTDAIRAALRERLPEVARALAGPPRGAALVSAYAGLPSISIDYGVLERARDVRTVPIDFTWSDVGSWAALPGVLPADAAGNFRTGGVELVAEDSSGNVVYGEPDTLTALVGVRDLVVVRSGECVLVCPRERAEEVKRIVERLAREGGSEHL